MSYIPEYNWSELCPCVCVCELIAYKDYCKHVPHERTCPAGFITDMRVSTRSTNLTQLTLTPFLTTLSSLLSTSHRRNFTMPSSFARFKRASVVVWAANEVADKLKCEHREPLVRLASLLAARPGA